MALGAIVLLAGLGGGVYLAEPDFDAWTPTDWTAAGTVAYAAVAVLAALFAGWQVWLLRRTRQEQARPFVVVDVCRAR
jgi:hypothetical protein